MEYLIELIILGGLLVAGLSFYMIRKASRLPANGEIHKLVKLNNQIYKNKRIVNRNIPSNHAHIH